MQRPDGVRRTSYRAPHQRPWAWFLYKGLVHTRCRRMGGSCCAMPATMMENGDGIAVKKMEFSGVGEVGAVVCEADISQLRKPEEWIMRLWTWSWSRPSCPSNPMRQAGWTSRRRAGYFAFSKG